MARPRGFPRGLARTSQRRLTSWEEGTGGIVATVFTTSGSAFLGSAVAPTVDGLTLVRTRGQWSGYLESASAARSGYTGAFGIGVATTAAVTAGVASVPTPITEQSWDGWLYWSSLVLTASSVIDGSAAADHDLVNPTMAAFREMIDSKAMRKLKEEDSLYAVVEVTLIGTSALVLRHDSRILLKLS